MIDEKDFKRTTSLILNLEDNQYNDAIKRRYGLKLKSFINKYNEVVEAGELIKAELSGLKDSASRIVEYSFEVMENKIKKISGKTWEDKDSLVSFIYYNINSKNPSNMPSVLKKISNPKKLNQSTPEILLAKEVLAELSVINDCINSCKEKVVVKKKAVIEKKAKEYLQEKMLADHKSVIQCKSYLKSFMSDVHEELVVSRQEWLKRVTDRIISDTPEGMTQMKYFRAYAGDPEMRQLSGVIKQSNNGRSFMSDSIKFKSDQEIDESLSEIANKQVGELVDFFVNKVASKIGPILIKKDNLKEISRGFYTVQNGMLEAEIRCNFKDNSEFKLRSGVEYAYSVKGTPFVRFPSRFSDVKFIDGSSMAAPNEEKMYTEFTKDGCSLQKKRNNKNRIR